jgi:uncharacterized membrane protein YqiK
MEIMRMLMPLMMMIMVVMVMVVMVMVMMICCMISCTAAIAMLLLHRDQLEDEEESG